MRIHSHHRWTPGLPVSFRRDRDRAHLLKGRDGRGGEKLDDVEIEFLSMLHLTRKVVS